MAAENTTKKKETLNMARKVISTRRLWTSADWPDLKIVV
jgi:hypothetical protein